jgi:hypothetical protein
VDVIDLTVLAAVAGVGASAVVSAAVGAVEGGAAVVAVAAAAAAETQMARTAVAE